MSSKTGLSHADIPWKQIKKKTTLYSTATQQLTPIQPWQTPHYPHLVVAGWVFEVRSSCHNRCSDLITAGLLKHPWATAVCGDALQSTGEGRWWSCALVVAVVRNGLNYPSEQRKKTLRRDDAPMVTLIVVSSHYRPCSGNEWKMRFTDASETPVQSHQYFIQSCACWKFKVWIYSHNILSDMRLYFFRCHIW